MHPFRVYSLEYIHFGASVLNEFSIVATTDALLEAWGVPEQALRLPAHCCQRARMCTEG